MKNKTYLANNSKPTLNVCINKSRVKVYKDTDSLLQNICYLKNNQTFQLELFNPTRDTILCDITFNNNGENESGLVLRPGERIFLERFLDTNKAFIFTTYEVSDTNEVKNAIANNGKISVKFYRESKPTHRINHTSIFNDNNIDYWNYPYTQPIWYDTTPYNTCNYGTGSPILNTLTTTTNNVNYNDVTYTYSTNNINFETTRSSNKMETGLIEGGKETNQHFEHIDKSFESFPFHTYTIQIQPESTQKYLTSNDIKKRKRYCTNCGKKLGYKDNFCSSCGTKA